jgi:hypothetical protein
MPLTLHTLQTAYASAATAHSPGKQSGELALRGAEQGDPPMSPGSSVSAHEDDEQQQMELYDPQRQQLQHPQLQRKPFAQGYPHQVSTYVVCVCVCVCVCYGAFS